MKSQGLSIAEGIREERKKAGMTQKELGKRLGVTQSMIAQYECGNRIPKILTIRRIADILEADLEPFYYAYHYAGKIAYDALREKIQRDKGCERCRAKYTAWEEGAPHEFRISDNAIFYFDPVFGWEGEGIAFCPYCGRELKGEERWNG